MSAPLDEAEYSRWRAAADRVSSASIAQVEAGLHEWACFLAEQAAQLAVKGLLHGMGRGCWGHDLSALSAEVPEAVGDTWPAEAARWAERLARFYIPTRYPDAIPGGVPGDRFGTEDSRAARADLERILGAVDAVWSVLAVEAEDEGGNE